MNHKTMMLVAVSTVTLMSATARAQTDDRAAQNRAAVRQMFPVVRLFDKKTSASPPTQVADAAKPGTEPFLAIAGTGGNGAPLSAGAADRLHPDTTPREIGFTIAAPALIKGEVATFDIAGFKLGMSEEDVAAVAKRQGLVLRDKTRVVDFETQVRSAAQLTYGAPPQPETGKSVLGQAIFISPDGGRYIIGLASWPDGAHVSYVTYVTTARMSSAEWRDQLTAKYGPASEMSTTSDFHARWCNAKSACPLQLKSAVMSANLSDKGGEIKLGAADGLSTRIAALLDQEAQSRVPAKKPTF